MKKIAVTLGSALVAVTVLAGCAANTPAPQGGGQPTEAAQNQAKEIVITAQNMMFEPSEITLDKGTKVKLTFKNQEDVANNLMIEGTSVKIENVAPKSEQSVEFVADSPGEFKLVASASGMESMTGKFIVK
jgi:plastocyanin